MKIFAYLIVFSFFLIPFIIYRSWYVRDVGVLFVEKGRSPRIVSIRPTRSWFRSFGDRRCFVRLKNGYVAQIVEQDPDQSFVDYAQIGLASSVYVFKRSRFGRYVSIDLSDRDVVDILKKF